MKSKLEAMYEILNVLEKHSKHIEKEPSVDVRHYVRDVIRKIEVGELFGINITDSGSHPSMYTMSQFSKLIYYGDSGRISWSDDDRQPDNEWLYVIDFPTGAYIFGDSYPEKTFKSFFTELKAFGPKYCDTANKSIYFDNTVAKTVHEQLGVLYKKYSGLVDKELKQRRKEKLKAELKKLEEE